MESLADFLDSKDKMILSDFIKSDFPIVFLGRQEQDFMKNQYAQVFIGADEVLYNIHKQENPLKGFEVEKFLNRDYNRLKRKTVIKENKTDYKKYFKIYENTIFVLDKVKQVIESEKYEKNTKKIAKN